MSNSNSNGWRRFGFVTAFIVVAGTAAVASYSHIRDVALYGHQSPLVAHLLPLSIDGMLLIASIAMGDDKANGRRPRGWARVGFWGGAAVSTAANVSATVVAWGVDPIGIFTAAIAPLVLLVSIEIVSRPGKPNPALTGSVTTEEYSAEDAVVPVSPAPVGNVEEPVSGPRGPYKGSPEYSGRQKSRLRKQSGR